MVNLKETRHQLAHKYDIATEDLAPSFIPILMAIDNMANRLEKSVVSFQHQSKQIESLMKQQVPPIYCDNPKTALIVAIGKYGSIALAIFLSVFWMGLVMLKSNENKYSHYKQIAKIIQFDEQSGSYFIRKEDYRKVEKGIVIKYTFKIIVICQKYLTNNFIYLNFKTNKIRNMLSHDKTILFLRRNPALSVSILEKEAGLPSSTLSKALNGDRILNTKHLNALYPILVKYGYNEVQHNKARVISIVNHKGGVGKTTTTINLGRALNKLGFKVLLVDMDSQGNLSQALGIDNPEKQVVNALLKNEELPVVQIAENYDLSPSDLELAFADLELVQAVGGVNQLKNKLNPLKDKYDYILIDCPPALNIFTNSALVASNGCLVTLQPEVSAMKGINNLFERISQVRERINPELVVEGIVLTMVDKRLKVHRDMIEYVYKTLSNFKIYKTEIRNNVSVKESQISQINIFDYDQTSNGAIDYMNLAKEFCSNT